MTVTMLDVMKAAIAHGIPAAEAEAAWEASPYGTGVNLRDDFAKLALQYLLRSMDDQATRKMLRDRGVDVVTATAEGAYALADAMMKARFK